MLGNYSKGIAAALSAGLAGVQAAFGGAWWLPAVTAGVGALLVVLVPNTPASAPQAPLGAVQDPGPHTGTPPAAGGGLGPLGGPR